MLSATKTMMTTIIMLCVLMQCRSIFFSVCHFHHLELSSTIWLLAHEKIFRCLKQQLRKIEKYFLREDKHVSKLAAESRQTKRELYPIKNLNFKFYTNLIFYSFFPLLLHYFGGCLKLLQVYLIHTVITKIWLKSLLPCHIYKLRQDSSKQLRREPPCVRLLNSCSVDDS